VLDLRGNSGGFLSELNSVLNTLLPAGVPVYTEMRQGGQVRVVRTTGPSILPASVPLVVLIDEGSASAAELLAAAIKETKRGQLIGERTSGAVEASVLFDLSDGSALSITTFRLATGRGVRLEGAGVEPDIQAALTVADLEIGLDRPLGAALSVARQVIAQQVR
jgi:carboxyl-terminal processing protease